ncbi:MAG: helix-turn-helix domain-containing protein [Marmoricola sp.]
MSDVVNPRRYDASRRRDQARLSRGRILDVARRRFLDGGFGATTIASIAGEALVSPDTIYKSFGGKPGLVRALCELALEGDGPTPAERRSDALQAAERDPAQLLRGLGTLTAEVAPRIAPLLLLLATAGDSDREMARLRTELDAARLERMTLVARRLARKTPLRPDLTLAEAGEIMWTYSSPELYGLLVLTRRWQPERYGEFVGDALVAALLPG